MKNCLSLLVLFALALPAHAGETADALAPRISFPVPEGLCALPTNETGNTIFARLDQIQRDIGNRLVMLFPNCADAELIAADQPPVFSHYAIVATISAAVTSRIDVGREEIIRQMAKELNAGTAGDAAMRLIENADVSLKQMGISDIEMTQPVRYVGQDELAVYALMRQRVSHTDKSSNEIMGVLSATSFNGVPVFVYYYDTPPTKDSALQLYNANKAYLTLLDSKSLLP